MPIKSTYYSVILMIPLFGALSWADQECSVSDVQTKNQAMALEARANTRAEQIAKYYRERAPLQSHSKDWASYFLERATPEQSSLFTELADSSNHLYNLTRINSSLISAKGLPSADLAQLQSSAAALFVDQQQFLESLTGAQREAVSLHLHAIEQIHHDVKKRLNRLANGTISPTSANYFKLVNRLKRDLERWNGEQDEIANRLGIRPDR